jgi:hypothetical protein
MLNNQSRITKNCPDGSASSLVFYNPNSSVNIIQDDLDTLDWVPNIHQSKFRTDIHAICCKDDIAYFKNLSAPTTVFTALDNKNAEIKYYAITEPSKLPPQKQWIKLCGKVKKEYEYAEGGGFFYPDSIILD